MHVHTYLHLILNHMQMMLALAVTPEHVWNVIQHAGSEQTKEDIIISVVWMLHSSLYLVGGCEEFAKYDSTMNIAEIQCRQH